MTSSVVQSSKDVITGEKVNVGTVERVISGLSGTGMAAYGIARRSPGSLALAAGGGFLLYRSITGQCPVYDAIGVTTAGRESRTVQKSVTIDAPPEKLYQYWRNLENLPRFMENLESVKADGGRSHWVARGPLDAKIEWDAEITQERENELISWRSVEGAAVELEGAVHFKPAPQGRGTEVKVKMDYRLPGGKSASALAWILGRAPRQQISRELRKLKQLMETGEIATIEGQPSGRKPLEAISAEVAKQVE